MADDDGGDAADRVAAAADELYAAPVEEFMSRRTALAKEAKADGASGAGKAIANLRKPTVGAAVVNRWVLEQPDVVDRLTALGDDLRRAQHDLDAATMRELSTRRRQEVGEIAQAALEHAGVDDATTALREEVVGTFDAAVADPETAGRLGRLVRSESFSGFGMPSDGPALTLVHGGKGGGRSPAAKEKEPKQDAAAVAAKRRLTRARDKAQAELDTADKRLADAEEEESSLAGRVEELQTEIAELQHELEEARRDRDAVRRTVKSARTKRRTARTALDRAERHLDA